MSFEDEQRIRGLIADLDARRQQLVHELGQVVADSLWADDWRAALLTAADHGVDPFDYARSRGLTRDEAATLVRQLPVDPR